MIRTESQPSLGTIHPSFLAREQNGRPGNKAFRRSVSADIHVHPRGEQNDSLSHAPRKALNLAKQVALGGPQAHFGKDAGKAEKAAIIGSNVRTFAETTHKLALTGLKSTKSVFKLKTGSWDVPAGKFSEAYKGMLGIAAVTGGLSFIKDTVTGAWQAVRDISHHNLRNRAQELLGQYDPATRTVAGNAEAVDELKQLVAKKGSDLSRSKGQVAVDHLVRTKNLLAKGVSVLDSSFLFAEGFSATAAKAVPVVGIVASAISTVHSAIKTGTQVAALNNLAKARAATNDPLLKALAGHIKQERTIQARKNLANTAVGAIFTGATIGLAASGVGAPAGLIAAGAISAANGLGNMAFDLYHNRKLAKAREGSESLMASQESLETLATKNIGVAEKAFLFRLRTAEGRELNDSIEFLRTFGISYNTIKKLQLAPEKVAIKTLQDVLYRDKVKFKGLQLKQTVNTLSHVVGLTTLGKRIKSGSLWLAAKLRPQRKERMEQGIIPAGHSLAFDPMQDTPHQSRIRENWSKLRQRPAYATVPSHFLYGRIVT